VANGTDSGPKALPGSFSFPVSWPGRGRTRHESGDGFVVVMGGALCGRRRRRS